MGTTNFKYPLAKTLQIHQNYRDFLHNYEIRSFNDQFNYEFHRINLFPSIISTNISKSCIGRIRAFNDKSGFFWDETPTPILDMVENPINMKNLSTKELKLLANEIRGELSDMVSKGHRALQASLSVVELTVAIHYVFHAPVDKILWDKGDQTYAHKLLTGRRSLMSTLGQKNGLSGCTRRSESEFDPFGSGHGCSSISAGLGLAVARDIKGKRERVVSVITNETTTTGQVYEAMSNAGYLDSNLLVILNDSRHSLHPKLDEDSRTPINALSSTLSKIQSSKSFRRFRQVTKGLTKRMGKGLYEWAAKVDEYARGMLGPTGSTLFEELGLYYIGPVDGNNIEDLVCVLQEVSSLSSMGPVLLHVLTNEVTCQAKQQRDTSENLAGDTAISIPDTLHTSIGVRTYCDYFMGALSMEAEKDKDIVVVHAGMKMEQPIEVFQEKFPDRFFDVGIAEQHAVTFSAGLACGGLKPFCIIPSAFLQRAYDQVVHDVDRQKVPVRFAITNAGLAGPDGPVSSGPFDITFMSCLPNMIVMAPSDEVELARMVATAAQIDDRPVCFRYPSGIVVGIDNSMDSTIPIEIGKGKVLVEGKDVALLGYGAMVQNCLSAHSLLSKLGVEVTVTDARFCKPLDLELVRGLCENHAYLITVEEGSIGGFGSHVAQFIALDGKLDGRIKWRPIVLPDTYIEHASPNEQHTSAGLTGHHIAATALSLLGRTREALSLMC
ncbi:hypothetical protein vseg_008832 [Gypsophila vaccaria]